MYLDFRDNDTFLSYACRLLHVMSNMTAAYTATIKGVIVGTVVEMVNTYGKCSSCLINWVWIIGLVKGWKIKFGTGCKFKGNGRDCEMPNVLNHTYWCVCLYFCVYVNYARCTLHIQSAILHVPPHRYIWIPVVTLWLGHYCVVRTWLAQNRSKVNIIMWANTGRS